MVSAHRPILWRCATLGLACTCVPLSAQARAPGGPGTAAGILTGDYDTWSFVAPLADLPRAFPGRSESPADLLEGEPPRVGLFWNGGNPGALPFEVDSARSRYGVTRERTSGEYRRPFDAGTVSSTRSAAGGRRRLGRWGAGVATATIEDARHRDGVFSDVVRPYTSSPYVVADTSGRDLAQLSARLEAAAGWKLGEYGLGLGIGFQGQETRTVASPVPRQGHSAGPGVGGGVVRTLSGGAVRLGVFGRWQRLNETTSAFTLAAPTRIYQIDGYAEAQPQDVSALYQRQFESEAWSVGAGATGTVAGVEWTLWGGRARLNERETNERTEDPRYDRWRARSTTIGGSLQRALSGGGTLTGTVRWTGLNGEAELFPSVDAAENPPEDPIAFHVDEESANVVVDFQTPVAGGRWTVAASLAMDREWRNRRDTRVGTHTYLDTRTLALSFDMLRELGGGVGVSAGGTFLAYDPVGAIPNPQVMGPVYGRWIAPEESLVATKATNRSFNLGARWRSEARRVFWVRLAAASLVPGISGTRLPLVPEGDRSSLNISLGVTLER